MVYTKGGVRPRVGKVSRFGGKGDERRAKKGPREGERDSREGHHRASRNGHVYRVRPHVCRKVKGHGQSRFSGSRTIYSRAGSKREVWMGRQPWDGGGRTGEALK